MRRVIFSDSAALAQDLQSRCEASIEGMGDYRECAASAADFRRALTRDPALSGIGLIAPVEAFLDIISEGLSIEQALSEMRSSLETLVNCLRDFRERLVLIDLSRTAPGPDTLAGALDLPQEAFAGFSRGDPDPVLCAVASRVLADDTACCMALEFLEASSAISPEPASPDATEDALSFYYSLKQGASHAEALQAEVSRLNAAAKLSDHQIRTMTAELGELGNKFDAASAWAETAEERVSALQARLDQSEARAAEGAQREAELSEKLAALEARIDRIRGFWTVRATKPIRRLGKTVRRKRRG